MALGPEELKTTTRALSDADVYWQILRNVLPLSIVGGVVAMTVNLAKIFREKTWCRRLLSCLCVVSVGCVSAGVAGLGLGLFVHQVSPELQIVSSAIAGSWGQRVFDVYGRKLFGRNFVHRYDSDGDDKEGPKL